MVIGIDPSPPLPPSAASRSASMPTCDRTRHLTNVANGVPHDHAGECQNPVARPPRGRPLSALRWAVGDQLPGWACRIRTGESVRELANWIRATTWPDVGASRAAETLRVAAAWYGFAAWAKFWAYD